MALAPNSARRRRFGAFAAVLGVAAIALSGSAGCDPRQAMYFLQPLEPKVPAPCPSLKGKKVVILPSAAAGLRTDYLNVDREIAKKLAVILKEKVKKIEVVEPSKVFSWVETKPTWTDPAEAAGAFDADVVIALEVREFQVVDPSSPGLLQGRAVVHTQAVELVHPTDERGKPMIDRPRESTVIHDRPCEVVFPTNGPMPVEAGVNPSVFKHRFLEIVVDRVSWEFVDHARGDDIRNARLEN